MDFVNKFTGGEQKNEQQTTGSSEQKQESGGFLGGIGNKLNNAAGGGEAGEKNEDYLDKGMYLRPLELDCYYDTIEKMLMATRRRLCPREVSGSGPTGQ